MKVHLTYQIERPGEIMIYACYFELRKNKLEPVFESRDLLVTEKSPRQLLKELETITPTTKVNILLKDGLNGIQEDEDPQYKYYSRHLGFIGVLNADKNDKNAEERNNTLHENILQAYRQLITENS